MINATLEGDVICLSSSSSETLLSTDSLSWQHSLSVSVSDISNVHNCSSRISMQHCIPKSTGLAVWVSNWKSLKFSNVISVWVSFRVAFKLKIVCKFLMYQSVFTKQIWLGLHHPLIIVLMVCSETCAKKNWN